ncbi:MAG: class II aldolase/adducin family protein [Cytophagales bacterium]|nr:class II aldolase/adducin family protein [Cytophagales bacterium]MDW8384405.1 class II aldolase/adducin family protein [Flammeovirgaceae bacterium]
MNFKNELWAFAKMSTQIGNSPDLVQGGGGNTSVKFSDTLMAIKASGFELREVTLTSGYAVVNYQNIARYFSQNISEYPQNVNLDDYTANFVKQQAIAWEGLPIQRPSMETGFHSVLDKYVLHTHSVYANILNCSTQAQELIQKLFEGSPYVPLFVPYQNPGFFISRKIRELVDKYKREHQHFPEFIFLENHGLIVSAPEAEKCLQLDNWINERIKTFLKLSPYPAIKLLPKTENSFEDGGTFIENFITHCGISEDYFEQVLFPDQTVYFSGNISFSSQDPKKIHIANKKVEIRANPREALTILQTLTAYLYIRSEMMRLGFTPKFISQADMEYINNMESEKFRKSKVQS